MRFVDKQKLAQNRKTASKNFTPIFYEIVEETLFERLKDLTVEFKNILIITPFPTSLSKKIQGKYKGATVWVASLIPWKKEKYDLLLEEETLPLKRESLGLIVSFLHLHWVEDVPGFLAQVKYALKPDGLFLSSLFGGESLKELKSSFIEAEVDIGVRPHVLPFATLQDSAGLLQRLFALPMVDKDSYTLCYKSLQSLFLDLKNMGEGNALLDRPPSLSSPRLFSRVEELYQKSFSREGRIQATFELFYLTGWKESMSQQKPLPRGSGQISLKEAL